jgi:deazaflavin-dependent oxidoreductase (nitroreductase family)
MTTPDRPAQPHYRAPGWLTRNVLNRLVAGLTRLGVSVMGSRVLETRGRTSGLPRRTPVNLLALDGRRYLVAPRGEAQWVRNVRADGGRLALLVGRRREELVGAEVPVDQREAVLRAYLKRWKAEVGIFFDGVDATSSPAELARIAPRHPVFLLSTAQGSEGA